MMNTFYLIPIAAALFTLIFGCREFYRWLKGIKVNAGYERYFDPSKHDKIIATVINRSNETQYITRCEARSTYSSLFILKRYLQRPFISPYRFDTIRFNSPSFMLLSEKDLKLEPLEPITLEHKLSDHPFSKMLTPMIQIELELSNGRIFRSNKIMVPENWKLNPKH